MECESEDEWGDAMEALYIEGMREREREEESPDARYAIAKFLAYIRDVRKRGRGRKKGKTARERHRKYGESRREEGRK